MNRLLVFAALAVALPLDVSAANAQVRYDAAAQAHIVTMRDADSARREVVVPRGDRVKPVVRLAVVEADSAFTYRYTISVDSASAQGLATLWLPCPYGIGDGDVEGGQYRSGQDVADAAYQRGSDEDDPAIDWRNFCIAEPALRPGAPAATLRYRSRQLPGLDTAYAGGHTGFVSGRHPDDDSTRYAMWTVLDSLAGRTPRGLVVPIRIPVAMYDRGDARDPWQGLRYLTTEITTICGETDWIRSGQTCQHLSQLVAAALGAVDRTESDRGAWDVVRQSLDTVGQMLNEQRGSSINGDAYLILNLLVRDVVNGIPPKVAYRWDEAEQTYWVVVQNDEGESVEMRVEPANRVNPVLRLSQRFSGSKIFYDYLVGADSASFAGLSVIAFPCPPNAAPDDMRGGDWRSFHAWGKERTQHCSFAVWQGVGKPLVPVSFSSRFLAGPGLAVAKGGAAVHVWPTSDAGGETLEQLVLVDSLSGRAPTGLVKWAHAPVPMHDPDTVAVPARGIAILRQDVTTICRETDWIRTGPTCSALLNALEAGTVEAVGRFLDLVEAGHRDGSVDDRAHAILVPLGRAVSRGIRGR